MPALAERLPDLLHQLATFSAPGPGVTRRTYDEAWCAAHAWLRGQARAFGLEATTDWAGNLLFHAPRYRPGDGSPAVTLVGSHLDSVTHGGRYDGAFGVLAALVIAAALRDADGAPVVAYACCEEEESRFPGALFGARSLLGQVAADEPERLADADGVTLATALAAARGRGCAAPADAREAAPLVRPARMLELHIEQGPVLEAEGLALGVVDAIAGYRRFEARLTGAPRHSGTTPMTHRRDALTAAAEIALAAETLGRTSGPPAVATAGFARAEPALFNVVPGVCTLGLEVRHTDAAALEQLGDALGLRCRTIAASRGIDLELRNVSHQAPVALSEPLVQSALDLARERSVPHRRMPSGAAHDAMVFARSGIPTLMLFVPSRGGVSHAPDEHTAADQLVAGCAFGIEWVRRTSDRALHSAPASS